MKNFLKRITSSGKHDTATSFGLLIIRLACGGLMLATHGWGKLTGFSEKSSQFADPLGVGSETSLALAILAEVFCAAAVILGLFTRVAAIPLVITMLVAAFLVHGDDPFQKKEFALLYAIPFFALVFTGAGKFSIDAKLS